MTTFKKKKRFCIISRKKNLIFSPLLSHVYFASYGPIGTSNDLTWLLVLRAFQNGFICKNRVSIYRNIIILVGRHQISHSKATPLHHLDSTYFNLPFNRLGVLSCTYVHDNTYIGWWTSFVVYLFYECVRIKPIVVKKHSWIQNGAALPLLPGRDAIDQLI